MVSAKVIMPLRTGSLSMGYLFKMVVRVCFFTSICPSDRLTAMAILSGAFIITPSITAWPPIVHFFIFRPPKKIQTRGTLICILVYRMLVFFTKPISLTEPFNASAGVNQFLLSGKEWVTLGAYFNPNLLFGGAGCKSFPARTPDHCFTILWMNVRLHLFHLFRDLVPYFITLFNFYSITYDNS